MQSSKQSDNEKGILTIVIWGSTLSVAASLAILFSFHGTTDGFKFSAATVLAFIVGIMLTRAFWRKVFALKDAPEKLWRFIIISCVLFVAAFIGCIFLPQFSPVGTDRGELLEGMILGFAAVAAVFFFVRAVMRMFERADEHSRDQGR